MKRTIILSLLTIVLLNINFLYSQTCQGPTALSAMFNDEAIPSDWTILSLDGNTLYWNMPTKGYTGEWQPYNHYGRQCVTSASRYSNSGASDDYLVTGAISLGAAPICLSWKSARAYNTPSFPNELYDVLISTTTPDPTGLHAHPALISVNEEEEVWIDYSVDLSAYAGQTIYIGFWQYTQNGYALCIDDIKVASPVNVDAAVVSLDITDVHLPGATINISGELVNGGLSDINSFSLNWSADGGVIHTDNISGLNLAPENYYSFDHTINWNPAANGTYFLKVWTSNINASNDLYALNDTITLVTYVNDFPRAILMEEFTNASCPPCADQNPVYDELIHENMIAEKVTAIKYHVAWPGYDPMNEENPDDAEERVAYYGVYGVPFAVTDGQIRKGDDLCYTGAPLCVDQSYIDSLHGVPAIFDISIGTASDGSNYTINAKITAKTDIPESSFTAHVILLEDSMDYGTPPGTNGEIIFYQVMRKMLPSSEGTALNTLSGGQEVILNYSTPIESYYSPDGLRALVFIQNENGKKVYQSEVTLSAIATGGVPHAEPYHAITIIPNPVTDVATISVLGQYNDLTITIFNALGEKVYNDVFIHASNHQIDMSSLSAGIYLIRVKGNDQQVIQKLVKE